MTHHLRYIPKRLLKWLKLQRRRLAGIALPWLFGQALRGLRLLMVCFLGTLAWFQVGNPGPWPPGWHTLKAMWGDVWWLSAVIAATVYAAIDVGGRLVRRSTAVEDQITANYFEAALQELTACNRVLVGKEHEKQILRVREKLLYAAMVEVERALALFGKDLIQLNLLLLCPNDGLECAARSKPGILNRRYVDWQTTVAGRAILQNRTLAGCHIQAEPGFESKPYDCVAGTPVAFGSKSYGVINADSKEAATFKGLEAVLDRILRRYAALVLLTLPPSASVVDCPEPDTR